MLDSKRIAMEVLQLNPSVVEGKQRVLLPSSDQFIEANTKAVSLDHLQSDCIIPVFAKDNESTISHAEFVNAIGETAQHFFKNEQILQPAIRISHPIKGRIPTAMGKPAKQLLEHEKTLYYERMAFLMEIPSIRDTVNGNELSLTIGGVRAYNQENLYSRKITERFKLFIGFKNMVCVNLCISTDGLQASIKVRTLHELIEQFFNLIREFDAVSTLNQLKQLGNYAITQNQFAQLIGKARMYPYLPAAAKKNIQELQLNDSQISQVVKAYYKDENFHKDSQDEIDLWRLYNLFTGANKSSYIDLFLERGLSALNFSETVLNSLKNREDFWYIN